MKNLKLFLTLLIVVLTISCTEKGQSYKKLTGFEENLPPELKGLQVYTVATGSIDYVKVAILKNEINSITYPVGKVTESTILLHGKDNVRTIMVDKILFENDSVVIVRKK